MLIHVIYRRKTTLRYKQKFESSETQNALLQHDLKNNFSENTISQIEHLKAELNSISDTKAKMKILNNRITFYEDYKYI